MKFLKKILTAILLSSLILFSVPIKSIAAQGCVNLPLAGCRKPFVYCQDPQTKANNCCGDGVNEFVGESMCAVITGASVIDQPSKQLGFFNSALFGANFNPNFSTPRGIISVLLPFLFTFAGLILFIMLLWGGFEMLTGAANPKAQEAGKARITAAIIGFLLIFASYWLAQILQIVFGISILK